METKTFVLYRESFKDHPACRKARKCQETEGFKGTEHEGVDVCEDGCVWFQPKIFGVSFLFAWYDLWVGLFWDKKKKWLYILPIPMFGIILKFKK